MSLVLQHKNQYSSSPISFNSPITSGSLLIAGLSANTNLVTRLSDTLNNTWLTGVISVSVGISPSAHVKIYYAENSPSGANTITWVNAGSDAGAFITEVAGIEKSNSLDATGRTIVNILTKTPSGSGLITNYTDFIYSCLGDEKSYTPAIRTSGVGSGFIFLGENYTHYDSEQYTNNAAPSTYSPIFKLSGSNSATVSANIVTIAFKEDLSYMPPLPSPYKRRIFVTD